MINVIYDIQYKPSFVRSFKKSDPYLQEEIEEAMTKLKNSSHHEPLRVHKLTGKLKDFYSCSVNYSHCIMFFYEQKTIITLVTLGTHNVYK